MLCTRVLLRPQQDPLAWIPAAVSPVAGHRVTIRAHADVLTGYGQIALRMMRELRARGRPVAFVPLNVWEGERAFGHELPPDLREVMARSSPDACELLFAPPNHQGTEGKHTFHFTMWESGRLPKQCAENLNRCRAVIVPSEWCWTTFDAAGVTTPIYKVSLAVDTDLFTPAAHPPEVCTFGTGGRKAHGGLRKGMEAAVEAFQRAFPTEEDVRFSLKCFPDCDIAAVDDPRVTIIREAYTDRQMADWYRSLTCYVSCAAAEGFGLMPLQAMACGVPVIATTATGHREYMRDAAGYPVRYQLARAEDVVPGNRYYQGLWYMPDLGEAAESMQDVRALKHDAEWRGEQARIVAEGFSWPIFTDRLTTLLDELGFHA